MRFFFPLLLLVTFISEVLLLLSVSTIILLQHHYRKMKTLFDIPFRTEHARKDIPPITENAASGHTVFAMASDTNRSAAENQDACCARGNAESHIRIVTIADGIGSSLHAKEGSCFVARTAVDLVAAALDINPEVPDFLPIFSDIQSRLRDMVANSYAGELSTLPDDSFGTTLLVGIDFPDEFVAAYVGNGAIYHLSGFFAEFPKSICLPWNSVNVLNPHSIPHDGQETLYKFFCYNARSYQYSPSVIRIKKDMKTPGDIFLLATDGIDSADQCKPVIDKQKNIYVPTSRPMDEFYAYLKLFLQGKMPVTDVTLQDMLQQFLHNMKEAGMLGDDSTLGVFISAKAQEYFQR